MAITPTPIDPIVKNPKLMVLVRQGKGLAQQRFKELTDETTAVGKQTMDGIRTLLKEVQQEFKNMFKEVKQLAIDVAATIPIIVAALASLFSAPSVPGQMKTFLTYVTNVVSKIGALVDHIGTLLERLGFAGITGIAAVFAAKGGLLPDWAFNSSNFNTAMGIPDLSATGSFISDIQAGDAAVAQSKTDTEDAENTAAEADDYTASFVDDKGEVHVNWVAYSAGIDTTQPYPPDPSAPYTLAIKVADMPGWTTDAIWISEGGVEYNDEDPPVLLKPTKLWRFGKNSSYPTITDNNPLNLKLFTVDGTLSPPPGTDVTDRVTWSTQFVPLADWEEKGEGEWRIGFKITPGQNFGTGVTQLRMEINIWPQSVENPVTHNPPTPLPDTNKTPLKTYLFDLV
jgi:hypothetical protein